MTDAFTVKINSTLRPRLIDYEILSTIWPSIASAFFFIDTLCLRHLSIVISTIRSFVREIWGHGKLLAIHTIWRLIHFAWCPYLGRLLCWKIILDRETHARWKKPQCVLDARNTNVSHGEHRLHTLFVASASHKPRASSNFQERMNWNENAHVLFDSHLMRICSKSKCVIAMKVEPNPCLLRRYDSIRRSFVNIAENKSSERRRQTDCMVFLFFSHS